MEVHLRVYCMEVLLTISVFHAQTEWCACAPVQIMASDTLIPNSIQRLRTFTLLKTNW